MSSLLALKLALLLLHLAQSGGEKRARIGHACTWSLWRFAPDVVLCPAKQPPAQRSNNSKINNSTLIPKLTIRNRFSEDVCGRNKLIRNAVMIFEDEAHRTFERSQPPSNTIERSRTTSKRTPQAMRLASGVTTH